MANNMSQAITSTEVPVEEETEDVLQKDLFHKEGLFLLAELSKEKIEQ